MLDLGVWMSIQSVVQQVHFNQRYHQLGFILPVTPFTLPVPGNGNQGNYHNYHGNYPITGGKMGTVTGFSDMPNVGKRGNYGNYPVKLHDMKESERMIVK